MPTSERRLRLLEIKRAAKLASADELAVLGSAYSIRGEGLAVPLGVLSPEEFEAKYTGEQITLFMDSIHRARPEAAPEQPQRSEPVYTPDGLILCAPDDEPPPAGKENTFRPNVLGRG